MRIRRVLPAMTVALSAALLVGCGPAQPAPTPPPSARPTPSVTAVFPEPGSETPTPAPTIVVTEEVLANVRDALTSGDTPGLASWMADRLKLTLAASECCGTVDAIEAADLIHRRFPAEVVEWEFELDATTVDAYREGDYAEFFPAEALVGRTIDQRPWVIAFRFADNRVSGVFYGPEDALVDE